MMDKPMNYVVLKGGAYLPSENFDLGRLDPNDPAVRSNFRRDNGFSGEIAVGRYLLPMLSVEIGAGYFQSKAFSATAPSTMLRVIPVVATGKVYLPLGVFEPYGLFGIGGYISDLDVKNDGREAFRDPELTFGLHAGAGFNINFTPRTFLGLEGKYLWVEPEFGGDDVKLDGFITTANLGFRF
jgi:outer membrane protein W